MPEALSTGTATVAPSGREVFRGRPAPPVVAQHLRLAAARREPSPRRPDDAADGAGTADGAAGAAPDGAARSASSSAQTLRRTRLAARRRGPRRAARRRRLLAVLRPTEAKLLFLLALAGYLTLGWYLTLRNSTDFGDALSRVSQAHFVLRSRDPHLGAIGFVFGPLPALLMLPFTWIGELWHPLLERGFLANVQSSLASAGAVVVLRGLLRDLGVGMVVRLALLLAFALHPLMLYYGGSGMSEPLMVLLLLVATRWLLRWIDGNGGHHSLTVVGIALGGAYLTRLEAVGACLAVPVLVPLVTVVRRWGSSERWHYARNDLALVAGPIVLCAAGWAVITKLIVGVWLGYASSSYGNLAQVAGASDGITDRGGATPGARLSYVAAQVDGLQPYLIPLVAAALLVGVMRRDARLLGAVAALGSVLTVTTVTWVDGKTFGWVRFSFVAVPFAVVLAGLVASRSRRPSRRRGWVPPPSDAYRPGPFAARWPDRLLGWTAGVAAVAAVALALPASADLLRDRNLSPQESGPLQALLEPDTARREDLLSLRSFQTERTVAAYLDGLRLPAGAVLTDAGSAFGVILASRRPHQFVATPDRDFERVVAAPARFGALYLLVPREPGFDALLATYPTLYDDGAGLATLSREFTQTGNGFTWRLYRLPLR